jgi:hypothetical protein
MSTTISKYDPVKYKTPTGNVLQCKGMDPGSGVKNVVE